MSNKQTLSNKHFDPVLFLIQILLEGIFAQLLQQSIPQQQGAEELFSLLDLLELL